MMTDGEIRLALVCLFAVGVVVYAATAHVRARRRHCVHRHRAGRSLVDPRAVTPTTIAIDYKHLDARRAWRTIVEGRA